MKPRLVRGLLPNQSLWTCYSDRAWGFGTTPAAAYNDWLINRSGIRG
jgi:hypothetical protein